jgi:hypothetical protein
VPGGASGAGWWRRVVRVVPVVPVVPLGAGERSRVGGWAAGWESDAEALDHLAEFAGHLGQFVD